MVSPAGPKRTAFGTALPQDSKFRRSPKSICCWAPPANFIPAKRSATCFIVFLLVSFTILQVGLFVAGGDIVPRLRILRVKWTYLIGKEWRYVTSLNSPGFVYRGLVPPYVLPSPACQLPGPENFVPDSSVTKSSRVKPDYDVCLAVSIGDDGDGPNDEAVPYPLVSRLTDAVREEAEAIGKGRRRGKGVEDPVRVLVGVDYGSVVCKIVRDSFAELAGVTADCRTFSELEEGAKCQKLVVGSSKRFVPQVPKEWSEVVEWKERRYVDLDCPEPSHEPPALLESDWHPTVVTGFSSNHMTVGLLLLRSIGKAVKDGGGMSNASVVVWAMETFDEKHQGLLDCVMAELVNEYDVKAEVRVFDWLAHPSWMRINEKLGKFGGTGEYAWKAIMVHTVLREKGMVLWADAGNRFHGPNSLVETFKTLKATGFVSLHSDGTVYTRTHPLLWKYYRANVPQVWDSRNCEAAIIGFTLAKYRELARPWYDCSMTRQCIAPDGSDHSNHRQDQAALSLLSILSGSPCEGPHPDFKVHADRYRKKIGIDVTGAYRTKCYEDPLVLPAQGTMDPKDRPHGIID